MAAAHGDVDYVPSYEVITGAPTAARFYAEGLREVTPDGVAAAMSVFFGGHPGLLDEAAPTADLAPSRPGVEEPEDELICEERLLEAFRP